ncbi:MAG: DUF4382 domain-containing protein, partial [Candidatus Electrothrix sp. ATG2]|nr:DUF4382 domain-containing protein [Candidatus Electrothrix sp. ATG2]
MFPSVVRSLGSTCSSLFLSPLLFLLILTGCSSDDVQIELTGKIDQSFSAGTKACLDISGNGQCDADEPFALTNSDGTYKITIPVESLDKFPLIVESATSSDNSQGKTIKLSAPAGKHAFVSPVSTAVQSRVYQGSSLAEAEAEVRTRYAVPENIDLYVDYQGSSVNPEAARVLIKAVEEVTADSGIDEPEETTIIDNTTVARRVVGYRASATTSNTSVENEANKEVADSSSSDVASIDNSVVATTKNIDSPVVAVTAKSNSSTKRSETNGKSTASSSADNSDKDSQLDDSDKDGSDSDVSGSDDPGNNDENGSDAGEPVNNNGNFNGSGAGESVNNSGNSNGSSTGDPGNNNGNPNGSSTGDPGNNNGNSNGSSTGDPINNGNSDPTSNFMSISAIQLDVLRIEACADEGGCTVASGPMQLDLLELPDGKVDLPNQVLLPENTKVLRLVLGDNNSIVVDDESFPLTVPSGQTSGLKLKGQKAFGVESGFLSDLTLNLNLSKQLVVQGKESKSKAKGKGKKGSSDYAVVSSYKLKPVIRVLEAEVTQPIFEEKKTPYLAMMVAQGTDKVKLAWVSGSDGKTAAQQVQYEIHLSIDENFIPDTSTLKKTVIGKTYTKLSELNENTIYYCKIIAHYSTYSSEPSNELHTKTYKNPVQQDLSVIAVKATDLGLGKHSTTDGITYIYTGGTPPEVGSILFSEDITGGMTIRRVDSVST